MVGIKVTQQIINQNEVNFIVGQIVIRNNYPNKFWVTEQVDGGYEFRTDLHEADGWKPYHEPVAGEDYNKRTQKLGSYIEEPTRFTKQILPKTQAEIDTYDQAQLDADEHATKVNQRRDDGQEYYYRIMALIERAWQNSQISPAIANAANTYFDDALEPILRGNWQAANVKLAVAPITTNNAFLNFYNTVNTYVGDYVNQSYSKK